MIRKLYSPLRPSRMAAARYSSLTTINNRASVVAGKSATSDGRTRAPAARMARKA